METSQIEQIIADNVPEPGIVPEGLDGVQVIATGLAAAGYELVRRPEVTQP